MIKPVKVTFKQDEEWLSEYINDRSSPSAYLKDLAIADYKSNTSQKTDDKTLHNSVSSNLFDIVD